MTKTELSVFMYGLYYVYAIGLPFLLIPHFALGLFGLVAEGEVWVRVLGLAVAITGVYYVLAVRAGLKPFYPWTVPARFATAGLQALLVALGMVGPALLLFAGLDALAGGLTLAALKAEARAPAAA